MAVVSNSAFSSEALGSELAQHGLGDFFQFVMSSADYVVRKPHPALLETAAGKLGASVGAVWYVGDTLRYDVTGAIAAGMIPVLYSPNGDASGSSAAKLTLSSWEAFTDLVEVSL